MKKVILVILFCIPFFMTSHAQKIINANIYKPETQKMERPFCIIIGYSLKNFAFKTEDEKINYSLMNEEGKTTSAFIFGISRVWEVYKGLGIETGIDLEFAFQNKTEEFREAGYNVTAKTDVFNLSTSIPILVQYRYEIFDAFSVFAFTGLNLDLSVIDKKEVNTKRSYANNEDLISNETDYSYLGSESDYLPFNLLWEIGAGVQYKFLKLRLGTDLGLINIATSNLKNLAFDPKLKGNKPFFVTLSFLLNKN